MKKQKHVLDINGLFSKSVDIFKQNWTNLFLAGLTLLVIFGIDMILGYSANMQGVATGSGLITFASWIASVYISIGIIRYVLNLVDNKKTDLKEIFHGVDSIEHFAYVVLTGLLTGIITIAPMFVGGFMIAIAIPFILGSKIFAAVLFILLGSAFIFFALYLSIGLMFSKMYIAENRGGVIDAIKHSWNITKEHKLKLFGLSIVIGLFNILGLLAFGVGLFITLPVSYIVGLAAYRALDTKKSVSAESKESEKTE